jgi:hypothetical protein
LFSACSFPCDDEIAAKRSLKSPTESIALQKAYRNNAGIETNRNMINCFHATVGVVADCFPIMIADFVGQEREISSHIVDAGNLRGLHVVAYQRLFVWRRGSRGLIYDLPATARPARIQGVAGLGGRSGANVISQAEKFAKLDFIYG